MRREGGSTDGVVERLIGKIIENSERKTGQGQRVELTNNPRFSRGRLLMLDVNP